MRLIDADALLLYLSDFQLQESPDWGANGYGNRDKYEAITDCIEAIKDAPEVDAVSVVHGHWIIGDRTNVYGGREIICSQCGESFAVSPKILEYLSDCERFCCRCGAQMDGKEDR